LLTDIYSFLTLQKVYSLLLLKLHDNRLDIKQKVEDKMKKIAVLVFVLTLLVGSTIILTDALIDKNSELIKQDTITLTIVTRHDVTIQNEFANKFLASPRAIELGIVDLDFRGATTDAGWRALLQDPAVGVDLAWGGGPALFNTMENWGLLKHIDNQTLIDYINANVPDEIAGAQTKSNDTSGHFIWVANAISSFGFTINLDFLTQYGLPVPNTWEELASPTYYIDDSVKAVSMGDPPLTTSNTRIYQIILQAFGWETGWSIITRMGGNAGIYPGSVDTRAAVVSGEVGIGMTIDFYGVIAKRENPNTEYIVPQGQSIVNGDPIALGINVDDLEAAEAFLQYLFSAEGQTVWMTEGLDRLPVNDDAFQTPYGQTRTDLYALYNETLANEAIPFNETLSTTTLDTTIYYFHNTITERHNLLRKTWGEMVTQLRNADIDSSTFQQYVVDLGAVNISSFEEAEAINEEFIGSPTVAAEYEAKWRQFAKLKYDAIYCELTDTCGTETPTSPTNGTDTTPYQLIPVLFTTIFIGTLVVYLRRRRK
jgi:ABC-type Fe3+ transport system substrate-binding protein